MEVSFTPATFCISTIYPQQPFSRRKGSCRPLLLKNLLDKHPFLGMALEVKIHKELEDLPRHEHLVAESFYDHSNLLIHSCTSCKGLLPCSTSPEGKSGFLGF